MNKQMLEDFIKDLKRKNKILVVSLIIACALFVVMTIFALSSFEINYENTADYDYTIDQDANAEGSIDQNIDMSKNYPEDNNNMVYMICGTVILCVLILTVGVVLYGKSKSKGTHNNTKNEENHD